MKKILLCSICMIFTLLVFTGCKNKKEEKIEDVKPTGNITYFSFNSGGGWAGVTYKIDKNDDNKYVMEVNYYGYDSPNFNFEVTEKELKEIANIIEKNEIYKWDGFDKSDPDVLDGDGFSLYVTYDSNDKIKAHGYMKYPKNYSKGANALKEYLDGLIETLAIK